MSCDLDSAADKAVIRYRRLWRDGSSLLSLFDRGVVLRKGRWVAMPNDWPALRVVF